MLKHGDTTLEWETIPEASRKALAQRGFTHIFGNEYAATRKRLGDAGKTGADLQSALETWTLGKLSAIIEGTLGVRVTSTTDPVEKVMERLAAAEIRQAARARKIELPKGDAFEALVEKYIARHNEVLREKAEAEIKAKAEQAKAAAEMADDILADLV